MLCREILQDIRKPPFPYTETTAPTLSFMKDPKLSDEQLKLVIEALHEYYVKALAKAEPKELKEWEEDHYKGKPIKVRQRLAFMQETLQYLYFVLNFRTGKLNETLDSSVREKLAGSEGEKEVST